ncbi:glucokinase [Oceanobacillus arenosus]|uniref:Glucokinase n=1 Tax=Oceanobacillus arenosus TaxID=1229153 RepID=A0A3D8Q0T9_9BACI|nr:ROK family protein [Oceanobacillus arenosus]RDW21427.1 glucokinase [Oceanobacillus arenosus]
MEESKDLAIGLDLGGTKILAALISREGEILGEFECKTSTGKQSDTTANIIFAINSLLAETVADRSRIMGIGVASAGIIDSEQKIIHYAKNIGLENFPIGTILEGNFQLPVKLSNDANAAAIGEWIWGAGKGKQNVIYITVSTGVGSGIISNGQLMTGINDSAGEFGHITISHDGILCECGNRGCLEKYASGSAINMRANQLLKNGETSSLLPIIEKGLVVTNKEVATAAKQGDVFSIQLLKEAGEYLGMGVVSLIHLFNTEAVVFGGGVMNMSAFILPSIKETVAKYGIAKMVEKVEIKKSVLGNKAGVIGATGLFYLNREEQLTMNK